MQEPLASFEFDHSSSQIPKAAGIFILILSSLVIVGWMFDIQLFKTVYPAFVSMKANTAIAFLLSGCVLLVFNRYKSERWRITANLFSLMVFLFGGLTLCEYFGGINFGIDQLFFKETMGTFGTSQPGRMAPNTALSFIAVGLSFILINTKSTRIFFISQFFTVVALLISWTAFLGYLFDVEKTYGIASFTQMAFHTSFTFVILSIGILFLKPRKGLVVILFNEEKSSILMRRLLTAALFVPAILGWLRWKAEIWGFLSTSVGMIIMVIGTTVLMSATVLFVASKFYLIEKERDKTEAQLKKLSLAVEHSPDYVVITDANGNIEYVNPKFSEVTGYTKEEAIGNNPRILKSGKVPKETYEELWKTIAAGKVWYGEIENKKKNGEFYWERMSLSPIFDSNKKITHYVAVNEDITYRKKVEEELKKHRDKLEELVRERTLQLQEANYEIRKSEERFRTTLDNMIEGGQIIDFDWKYTYLNNSAAAQGRLPREEYIGKTMMELYPGIENTKMFELLRTSMEKRIGTFMENEFNYHDGSKGWFELKMQPVPEGVFILSHDITERKRAEEQIRFQANLIACISDAIIATDMHFNIQSWNAGAEKLYGWKAEEVIGQPAKGILETDFFGQSREAVTKQIMEKGFWEGEAMHLLRDGKRIPTLSSVSIYRDSESKPAGIVAVNRDITERKQAEEEIKKLNESLERRVEERTEQLQVLNKELEAFTYSVSHDLRAPLRHINGFIDLLNKDENLKTSEKSNRYLNIISSSAKEMGMLIDDLLHFSKVGRADLKLSDVRLNELVLNVKDEVALDKTKKIEWDVKDLPQVKADPSLMKIVLTNLLGNAVKYSSKVDLPKIEVGSFRMENDEKTIYVKDNGAGFDMKYADKLFGVFQRLHTSDQYEGTGIGLATVRRIINKHGGKTWAEGEVNKGATFYFSLPEKVSDYEE